MKAHLKNEGLFLRQRLFVALLLELRLLLLGSRGDTGAVSVEVTRVTQELHVAANPNSKIRYSNI